MPTTNAFKYRVFMMYVDLDELESVFTLSPFWGMRRWSLAKYQRKDFWGDPNIPLKEAVLSSVNQQLGTSLNGPVRMLTNFRYFGYITNPLTTYYCFDTDGVTLKAIFANVNNTPWGEHHGYALRVDDASHSKQTLLNKNKDFNDQKGGDNFTCTFDKDFHVSPFNPIAMQYHWQSSYPAGEFGIHLENWQEKNQDQDKVMDATLHLQMQPITSRALNFSLIRYPLMTVKVVGLIYWQALKLWLKRSPIYKHPSRAAS